MSSSSSGATTSSAPAAPAAPAAPRPQVERATSVDEIILFAAHPNSEKPVDLEKITAATDDALADLGGRLKIKLPHISFLPKWSSVTAALANGKPRVVHFVSHASAGRKSPLVQESPKLHIDDNGVDGNMFVHSLSGTECVLVMACHSQNLLAKMPLNELSKIKHLVLCEGLLSVDEAKHFTAGFYSALLHHKMSIAQSIHQGDRNITKMMEEGTRTVTLHYYLNGVEKSINEIDMNEEAPFNELHLIDRPRNWVDRPELFTLLDMIEKRGARVLNLMLRGDDGIPGGTGKSTLARQLAYKLRRSFNGPHIELDMNTKTDEGKGGLDKGSILTRQREVLLHCNESVEDVEISYKKLFKKHQNGVLLFDDVQKGDDKLIVDKLFPPKDSGWLVLVTTRRTDLHKIVAEAEECGVGELKDGSDVKLLKAHAFGSKSKRSMPTEEDEPILKAIVGECGHIALAIEIVGAHLKKKPSLSVDKMLEKLQRRGALDLKSSDNALDEKSKCVAASFNVTYDDLSDKEKHALLQAAAFPKSFLKAQFETAMSKSQSSDFDANDEREDEDRWSDDSEDESMLDVLESLSLVHKSGDERYKVHDVVRQFTISRANREFGEEVGFKCFGGVVSAYFELIEELESLFDTREGYIDSISRMRAESETLEFLMTLNSFDVRLKLAAIMSDCVKLAVSNISMYSFFMKLYDEMQTNGFEAHDAESVRLICSVYGKVGHFMGLNSDWKGSIEVCKRAFEAAEKFLDEDDDSRIIAMHNYATALQREGGNKGVVLAIELLRQVVSIESVKHGPQSIQTLTSLLCLADALLEHEQLDEAIKMHRRALAGFEESFPEHEQTMTSKHNLAMALLSNKEYSEAIKLLKEVIETTEHTIGPKQISTLTCKRSLADALAQMHNFQDAIDLVQNEVIPGFEEVAGKNHTETNKSKIMLEAIKLLQNHTLQPFQVEQPKRNPKREQKRKQKRR